MLAVVAFTGGCNKDHHIPARTIRVAIYTDAPEDFDWLHIVVSRGGVPKFDEMYERETIDSLPDSLLLENEMPTDDKGNYIYTPVRIVVQGLASEPTPSDPNAMSLAIERSAELPFVLDHPVLLRMPLCASCFNYPCGEGTTCVAGACMDERVDPASLPEDDGSEPLVGPECPGMN